MSIKRVFAGWDRPGLEAAVEYLANDFLKEKKFDLHGLVIVVPGSRAGRRLIEMLVETAEKHGAALHPPEIVTQGRLPEKLYKAQKPFADDLTQQLAWVEAIRSLDSPSLGTLFATTPDPGDLQAWLHLGQTLGRLHRELAAEGLDFKAVKEFGAGLEGFGEEDRWTLLAKIQRAYLTILNELGLWDMQTARLFAIGHGECGTPSTIILLGTADMNRVLRLMLDQIGEHVKAIVFAPDTLASRFDEYGCIVPEAWHDADPGISKEQMIMAGDPSDQAACVLDALGRLDGKYAASEISIGITDDTLVPVLEQHLDPNRIKLRYGRGTLFPRTGAFQTLQQVAGYLESRSFTGFAALVRLPAVQEWLKRQGVEGDGLSEMDRFYSKHLPRTLKDAWPQAAKNYGLLRKVCAQVEALLEPLGQAKRKLGAWCEPFSALLVQLFGDVPLDRVRARDRQVLAVCEAALDQLRLFQEMNKRLEPSLSGAEALRLMLGRIQGEAVPPPMAPETVEVLGWLELPLDDAPVLFLTGFNDSKIPLSSNGDLFLPNHMRKALKIEDNDRRYARDAYALSLLAASRAELAVIFGRLSSDGDPLYPSRLLFTGEETAVAGRVRSLFENEPDSNAAPPVRGALQPGRDVSDLHPPLPEPLPGPVTSMRITEFSDYAACPYRYYLRHRLGLGPLDDRIDEISAPDFGSLAHLVLRQFGEDKAATSSDERKIRQCLDAALDKNVKRIYGGHALAVVRIQVEQLRRRLHAFALWQAEWVEKGWHIEFVEAGPPAGKALFMVDGKPMELRGRIDRIDRHVQTQERFIFDYKTSDSARKPESTHFSRGEWVDFQLPLYRHLASAMGLEGPFHLGYIALPKNTDQVSSLKAKWKKEALDEADRAAAEIVRRIRNEEFWPPADDLNPLWDDFAAICTTDLRHASMKGGVDPSNGAKGRKTRGGKR